VSVCIIYGNAGNNELEKRSVVKEGKGCVPGIKNHFFVNALLLLGPRNYGRVHPLNCCICVKGLPRIDHFNYIYL